MKSFQKLGLVSALAIGAFLLFSPLKALALSNSDLSSGSYAFRNQSEITAKFGGATVMFLDKNTDDGNFNYKPETGSYCTPKGVNNSKDFGITFKSDPTKATSGKAAAVITLGENDKTSNCVKYTANITVTGTNAASSQYQWNGNAIESIDGNNVYNGYTGNGTLFGLGSAPSDCGNAGSNQDTAYDIIVLNSINGSTGKLYSLTNENRSNGLSGGDDATTKWPALKAAGIPVGSCWDEMPQVSGSGIINPIDITITGSPGKQSAPIGTQTGSSGSGQLNDDASCEANSNGFSFAWAVCPLLDAANKASNVLIGTFEGQLSFRVSELGGVSGADNGPSPVHASWSLIRDIASSLIVIIMLIMVLSQAISFGPFDAYTIKKIMPKLVISVILMQLSWGLFSLVVNVFDDVGSGLANILYLPFGGAGNMDLWHLLQNAGLTSGQVGALNWAALPLVAFLGYAFIFTMLGVATTAIIALLAGLFTLIFRKTLIIMLLLLSPIALVAWILPGTQTYWKMWRENFIKALSMYPLAVGLIASGRIFAQVAGTQSQGDGGTFLNLIFIMVGFFGPLFILPKTFKWGGQAMKMAGDGISKAGQKIAERPKKYFDKQQEAWNHIRGERSAERYAHPEQYKNESGRHRLSSYWNRPLDRARAGDYNPLLGVRGSQIRSKQRNRVLAEAEEAEAKSRSENLQRIQKTAEERLQEGAEKDRDGNVLARKGGNKDDMYQDMLRLARGEKVLKKYYDYEGNEMNLHEIMGSSHREVEAARRAALDRMIQLGADTNWSHIDAEDERIRKSGSAEEKSQWRKFLNDNKDQVLEKMPDLLKGVGSVSDISAEGIARMHGAGIKRMLSKLNYAATDMTTTPEQRAQAQAQLNKFLNTYQEAITNGNTRGLMEQGGLRAVKAFVTANPTTRKYLLDDDPYKMHADLEDGRKHIREKTYVTAAGTVEYDPASDLLLKPIIDSNPDGTVTGDAALGLEHVDKELAHKLDSVINSNGSFDNAALSKVSQAASHEVLSPAEIRTSHQEEAARLLPPAISIDTADPTLPAATLPAREASKQAFKIQLRSDPNIIEVLANNIAYGNSAPQYHQALQEMRDEAAAAGTPEAIREYNDLVARIQRAMQKRINEQAAAAEARGYDPAKHRQYAQERIAPQITDLEPGGTVNFRKV